MGETLVVEVRDRWPQLWTEGNPLVLTSAAAMLGSAAPINRIQFGRLEKPWVVLARSRRGASANQIRGCAIQFDRYLWKI
jgi:hypothetical protein